MMGHLYLIRKHFCGIERKKKRFTGVANSKEESDLLRCFNQSKEFFFCFIEKQIFQLILSEFGNRIRKGGRQEVGGSLQCICFHSHIHYLFALHIFTEIKKVDSKDNIWNILGTWKSIQHFYNINNIVF